MPRRALVHLQIINRNNVFRNNNNDIRYPLIHMRDHLFHAAFVKLALIYARVFTEKERKIIEFFVLALSFLSLVLLSYIHVAFVQTPTDCLEHIQDKWPRDGILRVEILKEKLNGKYTLEKSYLRERKIKELEYVDLSYFFLSNGMYDEEYKSLMELQDTIDEGQNFSNSGSFTDITSFNMTIDEELNSKVDNVTALPALAWTDDEYIMEFSLEYGFLKLSPSVRKQYNISVKLVTLNPNLDKCFGGTLNNFILYNFLGYDEVLLASLKLLASKEDFKGMELSYVRNVLSEVEFVFINSWMDKKSYITAGFVMMVFTVSISILLRYSHHQIFVFIVELLHMLEFQSSFNFPAGPLLTVILALVGMEAIMSEFFNDTAIAFYVILIVWMADQYDTICCKSFFTKKHWLRFFYLYHFFFYAYSYRFGHNRFLALLTSWLFTLHSMVYFFHRYELPLLVSHDDHGNIHPDNPPQNGHPRTNQETEANVPENASANHSARTEAPDTFNLSSVNPTSNTDSIESNSVQQPSHIDSSPIVVENEKEMSSSNTDVSCQFIHYEKHFNSEPNRLVETQHIKSNIKTKSERIKHVCKKNVKNTFVNLFPYLIIYIAIIFLKRNLYVHTFLNIFMGKTAF